MGDGLLSVGQVLGMRKEWDTAKLAAESVFKRWKNCLKILNIKENMVLCIEQLYSTSASVT